MRRGISPIVAVVLLIAISIVAAVALYFYAGGLSTRQRTTETPIAISASAIDPAAGKIAIANLGDEELTLSSLNTADGTTCDFDGTVTIESGEQAICTMPPKRGETILYGTDTGQAIVILSGTDIAETTFQGTGFTAADWSTWDGSHTNTTNGSILLDATNWWEVKINDGANQQVWPAISSYDGTLHVAWYGSNDGDYDIYYANNSSAWTEFKINNGANDQALPSLAFDSAGVIHMVWNGNNDGDLDIYYANSSGWAWTEVKVNDGVGEQYGLSLAIDSNNVVHVVWEGTNDGDRDIYYANNSSGWTEFKINDGVGDQYRPSIASHNGIIHVAWYGYNDADADIYYANSSGWAWTEVKVNDGANDQLYPSLDVDTNGIVHIAWYGNNDGNYDIYYANSSSGWTETTVKNDDSTLYRPSLDADANNVIHVSWDGNSDGDRDIYYANSSTGWSEVVVNNGTSTQYAPSTHVQDGTTHIVWGGNNDGDYDIYYANSDEQYYFSGTFISDYIDTTYSPANFTSATWTNSTPATGTFEMKFQFSNASDFASHVNVTATTSPQTNLDAANQYARYWLNLTTTDQSVTPTLTAFSLNYNALNGNLTYTVNSVTDLSWVALNKTCSGSTTTPYNESASGTFYTNTETVPTACSYLVWGPGLANDTSYP